MEPLISIVIPVYNQQKKLDRALRSINKQTHNNIEVIIVDDGSNIRYQISDNRYRVPLRIIRQENRGAPAARNRGLAEAKGEYVIFWDADVIGEPRMIEVMYLSLQKSPDASFAYSNFYFGFKKFTLQRFNTLTLQHNNYIHSTSLVRKKDAILWDESLKRFQDWDYWLTLLERGKRGVWIDEYLFKVIPGGSMSSWLPKFAYQAPWRYLPLINKKARDYERAKEIIRRKHFMI